MKTEILFIQGGSKGAHQADALLVASLRQHLGPEFDVHYPAIPHEEEPDYQKWKTCFDRELPTLPDGAILVGHSLGGSFLLKYLVENGATKRLGGIFLISTPFWGGQGWHFEGWEAVALPDDFAAKLPQDTPIYLYHGSDDKTAPVAHLSLYAKKLPHAITRTLKGRDHQLNNDLSEVATDIRSR